jgi:hypothetical protein
MICVYIIAGFAAGLCVGALGFADAVFANAIFAICLGSLGTETTFLIVAGGAMAYTVNLLVMRKRNDWISWQKFATFFWLTICGLITVIPTTLFIVPLISKHLVAINIVLAVLLLLVCGYNLTLKPITITERAARRSILAIGFISGILGAIAGLSGVFTTIWVKARIAWTQPEARGVYQPFIVVMDYAVLTIFLANFEMQLNIYEITAYVVSVSIGLTCSMVLIMTEKLKPKIIEKHLPRIINLVGVIAALNLFFTAVWY